MRTWTQLLLMSFAAILTLNFAAAKVQSQCPSNITVGTPNIGSTPGAPFSAERISEWVGAPKLAGSPLQPLTELVARDGEGRVRIERVAGRFKLRTGNETREVEKQIVTICDPVAHQFVLLDEMNKTAQMVRQGTRPALHLLRSSAPFCKVPDAMEKSEHFRVGFSMKCG